MLSGNIDKVRVKTDQFSDGFSKVKTTENAFYLFVFSPKKQPNVKRRPYIYQFTDDVKNLVDEQVNDPMAQEFDTNRTPSVCKAILPDSNGFYLNTSKYDDRWTFVFFKNVAIHKDGFSIVSPISRAVLSGYFTDVPFLEHTLNTANPIPNLNAQMVFSSNFSYSKNRILNDIGVTSRLYSENIVRDEAMKNMYNKPLLETDIYGVANALNTKENMTAFSHQNVFKIPTKLNDPIQHLKDLKTHMVDIKNGENSVVFDATRRDSTYEFNNDFRNKTIHHILNKKSADNNVSVGTIKGVVMSLGQFLKDYPSTKIIAYKIDKQSPWDIKDQETMNPSTIFASMIAACVTDIASSYGLSSILFYYNDIDPSKLIVSDEINGVWKIDHVATIVPCSNNRLISTVNAFKLYLQQNLFNVLRYNAGPFEMLVSFDITGETIVDVRFFDFNVHIKGFHEISNRMASFYNPNLGTYEHYDHNLQQLHGLLTQVSATHNQSILGDYEDALKYDELMSSVDMYNVMDNSVVDDRFINDKILNNSVQSTNQPKQVKIKNFNLE